MLNVKNGKWCFLELQAVPAIDEYLSFKGIRESSLTSQNDVLKFVGYEAETRHDSLMMCMRGREKMKTINSTLSNIWSKR